MASNRKNFSQHHQRAILPGQVWIRPFGQATNRPWEAEWRVMAVAEGYAMGRLKGAAPSIVRVSEMEEWRLSAGKSEGVSK